jgi:hypothetical protein
VKALAPPFLTKLPLADEVAHSVLSHGFAYWNVASAAEMLRPSKWCQVQFDRVRSGRVPLTLGAHASAGALRVCPQPLCCTPSKSDSK